MGHPYMLKGISSVLQKLERTAQRDCSDTTLWDPTTTSPHTGITWISLQICHCNVLAMYTSVYCDALSILVISLVHTVNSFLILTVVMKYIWKGVWVLWSCCHLKAAGCWCTQFELWNCITIFIYVLALFTVGTSMCIHTQSIYLHVCNDLHGFVPGYVILAVNVFFLWLSVQVFLFFLPVSLKLRIIVQRVRVPPLP